MIFYYELQDLTECGKCLLIVLTLSAFLPRDFVWVPFLSLPPFPVVKGGRGISSKLELISASRIVGHDN